MSIFSTSRNSNTKNLQTGANYQYINFWAEYTVRSHSPAATANNERPLVTEKDGRMYPYNPTNKYIVHFADELDCCFRCGSTQHQSRSYSRKDAKVLPHLFWQELWVHIPSTRAKPSQYLIPDIGNSTQETLLNSSTIS